MNDPVVRSQVVSTRTELIAERGMVVGGHAAEAESGVRILLQGGNAVDAVVAAAFTGFVVEPASCGVGGYGHLALYLADRQEFVTIDHFVRAPLLARQDMYELDPAQPPTYHGFSRVVGRQNELGPLSIGVPSAVAGLCLAHQEFGKLRRARVLEPAIEAADAGVPVTEFLAGVIGGLVEPIRAVPEAAARLLRNGNPPAIGGRIDCSELAQTLRRIAHEGAAGFYAGPVAETIGRWVTGHGGILTAEDLAAYRPKVLRERPGRYRALTYVTANDQVGYETLNILDHFDLTPAGPDGIAFRHLMAEAMGHAFADNLVHYGDPDHAASPVDGLASRAFAAERAAAIRRDRAASRPIVAGNPWPYESRDGAPSEPSTIPTTGGIKGTSQMVAADADGNLAALCTSLETGFGSLVLVPGTGVFLNNAMQNFDARPGHPNSIAPGKMPIFGVPTIVATENGRPRLAIGGSGGYRILTAVVHPLVHAVDFGMGIQAGVDAPRVHCQGGKTEVDDRIPPSVQARLAAMGHDVEPRNSTRAGLAFGRVCAILVDPQTGLLHGGSGPADLTAAAGW